MVMKKIFQLCNHRYAIILKKNITSRGKTVLIFAITIILSYSYYLVNLYSNNSFMKWVSSNLLVQTIIFFLTISGLINIFTPFTVKKEITRGDIEEISINNFEKKIKRDKLDEIIRNQNSI